MRSDAAVLRVAQVGLGRIGAFHANTLARRVAEAELAMVVDADAGRAEATGSRYGVPWSRRFEDILSERSIDAVLIASPTPLHPEMVEGAAAAGKHIFCEKPLSLDARRADDALLAVRRAGVMFQIGFHRRFDPDFLVVKERIADGSIGDIRLFRATCRDMHPPSLEYLKSCGGIFADVTLHDFDVARWLVGEIDQVYAMGAALSDPAIAEVAGDVDNVVVALRFRSGALGLIDDSRASGYGYDASLEVMGSRSTVRVGAAAQRVTGIETLSEASHHSDIGTDFVERFAAGYVGAVAAFVKAVLAGRRPAPGGEDAVAAFSLAQAARQSMTEGRPIPVPVVGP
jgi:myo-inositol 2-dehydrogenase / D-chiro-inositol 1-dehydrogenase